MYINQKHLLLPRYIVRAQQMILSPCNNAAGDEEITCQSDGTWNTTTTSISCWKVTQDLEIVLPFKCTLVFQSTFFSVMQCHVRLVHFDTILTPNSQVECPAPPANITHGSRTDQETEYILGTQVYKLPYYHCWLNINHY